MDNYEDSLKIGLILTRLDYRNAYFANPYNQPPMDPLEEYNACRELREGFRQLLRSVDKPQIILVPELAVPRGFLSELNRHACSLSALCIFGIDYLLDYKKKTVQNEIRIVLPDRWPRANFNKKVFSFSIFKSNPSPKEKHILAARGWDFSSDNRLWLFDGGPYGSFGVANCYDFLDVEMHLLYKKKIQHLFVLSYNKDVTSFWHTAESLCRTLFCNVIICNTGFFGVSVCVAPFKEPHRRLIYKNDGNNLFATQVLKLPVNKIIKQQIRSGFDPDLKDLPPAW